MIDAPLELAFGAGMAAAFNPCGFALLPAYVSFFLGTDAGGGATGTTRRVWRAVAVGAAVTAGFVAVFGVAGLLISHASLALTSWTPYAGVVIGAGLVVLGVAILLGFEFKIAAPGLAKGGQTRGLGSMALFGVSYATVSLTCTLPIFLAAVSTTFRAADVTSGVAAFVAYAMGMGAVLMVVTLALALSRQSIVARLRSVLPWMQKVAGLLLIAAGAYVAYYGYYDIQINRDADVSEGPVAWVTRWSGDVTTWISEAGAVRIGVLAAGAAVVVVGATAVIPRAGRRRARGRDEQARTEPSRSAKNTA